MEQIDVVAVVARRFVPDAEDGNNSILTDNRHDQLRQDGSMPRRQGLTAEVGEAIVDDRPPGLHAFRPDPGLIDGRMRQVRAGLTTILQRVG